MWALICLIYVTKRNHCFKITSSFVGLNKYSNSKKYPVNQGIFNSNIYYKYIIDCHSHKLLIWACQNAYGVHMFNPVKFIGHTQQ